MANVVDKSVVEAGAQLRAARREMGYTGHQIERLTEKNGYRVPQAQVSRIERGVIRRPPPADLSAIAEVLQLNVTEVLKSFGIPMHGLDAPSIDARVRRIARIANALPNGDREKFLQWLDFAATQALADITGKKNEAAVS